MKWSILRKNLPKLNGGIIEDINRDKYSNPSLEEKEAKVIDDFSTWVIKLSREEERTNTKKKEKIFKS